MSSIYALLSLLPWTLQAALGVAVLLMQIVAAVHAVRTGRPLTWLWLIFVLPGVGALVYLLSEVLPYRGSGFSNPFPALLDRLIPGRELRRLTEALQRSSTVANRVALAEYHLRHGQAREALALYQQCLTGVYKDDPLLMRETARVHFQLDELDEAKRLLDQMVAGSPTHEPQKRDFWLARIAEEKGQAEEAFTIYERMRTSGPITEEARVRLALLFEQRGDRSRARELFDEVVRRMRTANNTYRREQKPWLVMARQRLKERVN